MILPDDDEIREVLIEQGIEYLGLYNGKILPDDWRTMVKTTGKKILIKLQAIYNLPEIGMYDEKMKEFIKELEEEVK